MFCSVPNQVLYQAEPLPDFGWALEGSGTAPLNAVKFIIAFATNSPVPLALVRFLAPGEFIVRANPPDPIFLPRVALHHPSHEWTKTAPRSWAAICRKTPCGSTIGASHLS